VDEEAAPVADAAATAVAVGSSDVGEGEDKEPVLPPILKHQKIT